MFCSRCGTKNPENSAYCYNCGQNMVTRPDVSELNHIDVKKFKQKLKDGAARFKNNKETERNAPMHLFFYSAVDCSGVTRFFDIMQDENGCSLAETATTAPILGQCVETNYSNPGGNGRHHGHRIYGKYSAVDPHRAMLNFATLHRLTQVTEMAETLNLLEAEPIWKVIWQKLGCPPAITITTRSQFLTELIAMTEKMTPEEKAQFRVDVRKKTGLPERPEPLLEQAEKPTK